MTSNKTNKFPIMLYPAERTKICILLFLPNRTKRKQHFSNQNNYPFFPFCPSFLSSFPSCSCSFFPSFVLLSFFLSFLSFFLSFLSLLPSSFRSPSLLFLFRSFFLPVCFSSPS